MIFEDRQFRKGDVVRYYNGSPVYENCTWGQQTTRRLWKGLHAGDARKIPKVGKSDYEDDEGPGKKGVSCLDSVCSALGDLVHK